MYQVKKDSNEIYFLDYYHPYRDYNGQPNPAFNSFSGLVLDLKENKHNSIRHFAEALRDIFDRRHSNFTICTVPSHDPATNHSGIISVAQQLLNKFRIDGTGCLVRTRPINKLATGGVRSVNVHLQSIMLKNKHLITRQNVVILDDVTTSGNSLLACKKIIEGANPISVIMFSIAKTQR